MENTLREARTKQNISQEALAEELHVSRQTVSNWERGAIRPSIENLTRLSEALGISMDALVKDEWSLREKPSPAVQVIEAPAEIPVSKYQNYRLWVLLTAIVLMAGIVIWVLFSWEQSEKSVPETEMESEVIDGTAVRVPLLPLE